MAKKNKGKGKNKGNPPRRDPNDRALEGLYGPEGVNAGNALINKFLQPGALGRVEEGLPGSEEQSKRYEDLYKGTQGRDPIQEEALANMQKGLGGYTSPEYQAQREQMMRGQQSNLRTGLSQLAKAQARGKVYGAAGAAQQANMLRGSEESKNQLEQDLYVKNIDEMGRRNLEYGQYGRGLNEEEYSRRADATSRYGDENRKLRDEQLERQKINMGQFDAEHAARIGAFTGAGGTAIAKAQNKAAQKLQKMGINKISKMA